ncbi:MAG: AMP-binding protein [Deltaproteobacteria bacterium]|nr:AMP-binding protein [Deltaproteobacteria bacterium]
MKRFDNYEVIIPDFLALHGKHRAARPALVCGDRRFTWAEFSERIDRVANGLIARGLKKGDKVSLLSSNCIEMPEIIFGVVRAGGVIVPLSAMVTGEALARMIDNSDSTFLFVRASMCEVVKPFRSGFDKIPADHFFAFDGRVEGWGSYDDFLASAGPEPPEVKITYYDPFNIMYTSGTTGRPKGILHHHANRMYFAGVIGLDLSMNAASKGIVSTSLYANGTWLAFLPIVFSGGCVVVMEVFDPIEFARLIQQEKCTHTFMAPVQFQALLENIDFDQYDLSSMKVWVSGGSAMRTDIKRQVLEKFPGELMDLWGLTEGVATIIRHEEIMAGKMESVGLPLPGMDVRIIDDDGRELPRGELGEIVGYSPFLMPEYYKLPEKTAESIWVDEAGRTHLKTGDMGKLDEDGFLYILDRKKDMILSGGINIFANDLEQVIGRHPDVSDVTVIAVPHKKWGETPLALVIRRPGAEATGEEIKAWANPQLAKYQRLHAVEFVDDLPRNALGKVLKRQLREPYWKDFRK